MTAPSRITFEYLARHALELFNLERGIGFTIWRWLFQPGQAAQEFLFIARARYVKPFTALALAVTIMTYVSLQWVDIPSQLSVDSPQLRQIPERARPGLQLAMNYVVQFFHVFLVIALPFQAAINWLIFRGQKWHYPEHLVVVTYLYTIQTLLSMLFLPLIIWQPSIFGVASAFVSPAYLFWAIWQVYQTRWWCRANQFYSLRNI